MRDKLLPIPFGSSIGRGGIRRGRRYRRARIEYLEPRLVMAGPELLGLPASVSVLAGTTLHVALDGSDLDGDAITYEVSSSNPGLLLAEVPQGNDSMRISVEGFGDMVFELFDDLAPGTTGKIKAIAQAGDYDNVIFHRVASSPPVIQGGDPTGTGSGGAGVDFDDEFNRKALHTSSGVLSMAKSFDDTNNSQFFITAADTRYLDLNHSVFGILKEGESVRAAIQSVPVDAGDRPKTDVVMEEVAVFTDPQNAVLRLTADAGQTGTSVVTITARDSTGQTEVYTRTVTVVPDTQGDRSPYFSPIPKIQTTVDSPVQIDMTTWLEDWDGGPRFFGGWNLAESDPLATRNPDLDVDVDPNTGSTTITPSNGIAGVHGVLLGVNPFMAVDESTQDPRFDPFASRPGDYSQFWDFQFVPVYIHPPAPTVRLAADFDTGVADDDGLTSLSQLNPQSGALEFVVTDVIQDADVTLRIDGRVVTQTVVERVQLNNGTFRVTVRVDGGVLAEGSHQVTATQTLRDQPVDVGNLDGTEDLHSDSSAPFTLTIDNTAPTITSDPPRQAYTDQPYRYDMRTPDEVLGDILYWFQQKPDGMEFESRSAGRILWIPADSQVGTQSVQLLATDVAGNADSQAFDIVVAETPVIDPIDPITVSEGSPVTFTASASGGVGDLRFSLDPTAPDGTPLSAGAVIDPVTGQFLWQTGEADGRPGTQSIAVRVTDQTTGASSIRVVSVTVTEMNQPPDLQSIGGRLFEDGPAEFAVDEGKRRELPVVADDGDIPANTLTFSLGEGAPPNSAIDPDSGLFTFSPDESQGGRSFQFVVLVSDGSETDEATFTVTVREDDKAPRFADVADQEVSAGDTLELDVTALDPDDPALPIRYGLEPGAPADAAVDSVTGHVTWPVPEDQPPGDVQLTVRATEQRTDGTDGRSETQRINISVAGSAAPLDLAALLFAIQSAADVATDEDSSAVALDLATGQQFDPEGDQPPASTEPVPDAGIVDGFFGTELGTATGASASKSEGEGDASEGPMRPRPPRADENEGDEIRSERYEIVLPPPQEEPIPPETEPQSTTAEPQVVDAALEGLDDSPPGAEGGESESKQQTPAPEKADQIVPSG